MLISLTVVIISQCMCISKWLVVCFIQYVQLYTMYTTSGCQSNLNKPAGVGESSFGQCHTRFRKHYQLDSKISRNLMRKYLPQITY